MEEAAPTDEPPNINQVSRDVFLQNIIIGANQAERHYIEGTPRTDLIV